MLSVLILTAMSQTARAERVDSLPTNQANKFYVGNRAPLARTPLIKLPVGSVRAKGWLQEYLKRQKNGMTGHLTEISAWLQKDGNAWLAKDGKGKWGWEEVPYWLKGYGALSYLLEDKAMIKESKVWIEAALHSQRPNGDFGPDLRFKNGLRDYWANMLMLNCLQSYYEYSHDQRVIDLMTKYFRYQLALPDNEFLTEYWQHIRGGDNLASIYWLYNRTGDAFLLDLAKKNHASTADWSMKGTLPDWHNVNVAQSFDEPAIYSQQTKDKSDVKAAYDNFATMRKLYGEVPGGMYGADENARPGKNDPRQAIETCGIVEQMLSDEELLAITGDIKWADHCENVAFNTYPAAVMPDFKALRYLTSPNMVTSDRYNHAPGYQNGGPMTMMNPLSHRCCQHNHSHGWPFFTENLWMATNDNGLAATIYSAGEVSAKVGNGTQATITETTNYPFEETLRFEVKVASPTQFPLYLRIPAWCKRPELNLNGKQVVLAGNGAFVKLSRTWKKGDQIALKLPMALKVDTWTDRHDSVSVNYGPLTFSLKIGEKVVKADPAATALSDSGWNDKIDKNKWPAYELTPTTPWNYALKVDPANPGASLEIKRKAWPKSNFPFTLSEVPIEIRAKGKILPQWKIDRTGLVSVLQDGPVKSTKPLESITLVPMGAARLRISAFPWLSETGKTWTAPPEPLPYNPKASHVFESDDIFAPCDQMEPKSSSDESVNRFTWWPRKGSEEWIEYNFATPKKVKGVSVYWFDDTGHGECRIPASWSVEAKVGNTWQTLANSSRTTVDEYNHLSFTPTDTKTLRLKVKLQPNYSGGILEWKVNE